MEEEEQQHAQHWMDILATYMVDHSLYRSTRGPHCTDPSDMCDKCSMMVIHCTYQLRLRIHIALSDAHTNSNETDTRIDAWSADEPVVIQDDELNLKYCFPDDVPVRRTYFHYKSHAVTHFLKESLEKMR